MSTRHSELLNEAMDISTSFSQPENICFHLSRVAAFDPHSGQGEIEWQRYGHKVRTSFNQAMMPFERVDAWEFPPGIRAG